MQKAYFAVTLGAAALLLGAPAMAADHQVEMLNKDSQGRVMQFEPAFLSIAPGDTVTFVATSKGHDTEALAGLIPAGAEGWKGKINEEITVTFDTEGLYAYKCQPHLAMGMVGLIQVGEATEPLDAAALGKLPRKAQDRLAELVEEAGAPAAQ
jgi:pseudoazurin